MRKLLFIIVLFLSTSVLAGGKWQQIPFSMSDVLNEGYKIEIKYYYKNLIEEKAYEKEKELIENFGRIKHDKNGILTNITEGGITHPILSMNEEQKEIFSKKYKGNKNPNAKKIEINDIMFETINEASDYYNVNPATITRWIKNGKGIILSDKDWHHCEYKYISDKWKDSNSKKIEINGIIYETVNEAANKLDVHRNTILNWIKNEKVIVLSDKQCHLNNSFNKKQSDIMKNRLDKGGDHPMLGKNHSEETKNKQSKKALKKKVIIDGIVYESLTAAGKHYGKTKGTIWNWIQKGKASYS